MKKQVEVIDNGYVRTEEFEILDELEYEQSKDGVYVATKRSKIRNFYKKNQETFAKIGAIFGAVAGGALMLVAHNKDLI